VRPRRWWADRFPSRIFPQSAFAGSGNGTMLAASRSLEDTSLKPILWRQWHTLCGAVIKTSGQVEWRQENSGKGKGDGETRDKEKVAPFSRSWRGLEESHRRSLEFFSLPAHLAQIHAAITTPDLSTRTVVLIPDFPTILMIIFVETALTFSRYFECHHLKTRWKSKNSSWNCYKFLKRFD